MGVDKNDVRTVVHLAPPASVEAYLQETGRASRDGGAEAWLIVTPENALGPDDLRSDSPEKEGVGRLVEAALGGDSDGQGIPIDPGASLAPLPGNKNPPQSTAAETIAWSRKAPEKEIILKDVRWNRGRFRKGQLARILIGGARQRSDEPGWIRCGVSGHEPGGSWRIRQRRLICS